MTQLGLALEPPSQQAALGGPLGTVPGLFRRVDPAESAEAVWLGAGTPWPRVAEALADGARAVAVETTSPPSAADLLGLDPARVLLVGSRTHAPQIAALAEAVPAVGEIALIDAVVVDGGRSADPVAGLWDAFAMLTAAGLVPTGVPHLTAGPGVLVADAPSGAGCVHLTWLHQPGAGSRATITVCGSAATVRAELADPAVAAPGEVITTDGSGATMPASQYRTPRQVALQELYQLAVGDAPAPVGLLARHADVAALFGQIVWPHEFASPPREGTGR